MPYQDERDVKSVVLRYQQRIFALALYLIGGNRDKAYDIAGSSFADAIRKTSSLKTEDAILIMAARAAVEKSREARTMPSSDESDLSDFPAEKRESLRVVKEALQKLPFETRALLLLRDQIRLPYADIACILQIPWNSARSQMVQARLQLRGEIEGMLSSMRGYHYDL